MSSIAFLLGLLVVAYVGSQLMSRAGGYRLASGAEYLVLGVALGPHALGAAERSTLHAFQPIAVFGTAWLTLVIGLDYGFVAGRKIGARGLVAGLLVAAGSAVAVAAAVYAAASRLTALEPHELRLLSAGVGLVASETTRHAVRFVVARYSAAGPLSRFVTDLAEADDLVPILGMAALFPLLEAPDASIELPWWAWFVATLAVGGLLGITSAALLRAEQRASAGWGVLIGASLLAAGAAWQLGLAPQAATFALGVSLSLLSRHRRELRALLAHSEASVLLPILLLAGAEVELHSPTRLAVVVTAALLARAAIRFAAAPIVAAAGGSKPGVTGSLALGLMPSGALSIIVGLGFASRFPGIGGDAILSASVVLAVIGEMVGPSALRRAFERAGEIEPPEDPAAEPAPELAP